MSQNGPVIDLLKKYKIIRKLGIAAAVVAGAYVVGTKMGWW